MNLTKLANGRLSQAKEVAGLLSSRVDYEIKGGQGQLDYLGPKFTPAMWHQVMSFFRWTNKEMNSESQVRLYVNLKLGRWGAWAFPQAARTGMSAREVVTPETPEQAAERFASWGSEPSGDWFYFGTVHHHCSASAFQSGTDEANERNQDGLHLTVGRMDAERHDLHARFYLAGNCFAPDLSRFWPIEPELARQVSPTMLDELARFQMGEMVVVDFPDAWRKNVLADGHLEEPRAQRQLADMWAHLHHQPVWLRTERAWHELIHQSAINSLSEEELWSALQTLASEPVFQLLITSCLKQQVTPEDLLEDAQSPESADELNRELGF